MPRKESIFTPETFRFFKELDRNNKKTWMDANRERYHETVVQPFRRFLDVLAPEVLGLDGRFDTTGRTGANFSRINRDIRFAKDKTPYRAQMYVKFSVPFVGEGETGQLYVGLSKNSVTAGFRVYGGSKRKLSALGMIADPHVAEKPKWIAQQKKRLGTRYQSYWYSTEKGGWHQRAGWPSAEEFARVHGWIVRKKLTQTQATRAAFPANCLKVFRDVYPLLQFTCCSD